MLTDGIIFEVSSLVEPVTASDHEGVTDEAPLQPLVMTGRNAASLITFGVRGKGGCRYFGSSEKKNF